MAEKAMQKIDVAADTRARSMIDSDKARVEEHATMARSSAMLDAAAVRAERAPQFLRSTYVPQKRVRGGGSLGDLMADAIAAGVVPTPEFDRMARLLTHPGEEK